MKVRACPAVRTSTDPATTVLMASIFEVAGRQLLLPCRSKKTPLDPARDKLSLKSRKGPHIFDSVANGKWVAAAISSFSLTFLFYFKLASLALLWLCSSTVCKFLNVLRIRIQDLHAKSKSLMYRSSWHFNQQKCTKRLNLEEFFFTEQHFQRPQPHLPTSSGGQIKLRKSPD